LKLSEHISELLNKMSTISLNEMESVKLMNRMDSKYLFHLNTLPKILAACNKNYSVVSIHNKNYSTYQTLYYDTFDFSLYNQHHSGKLNRYKIRKRTYIESELSFLEIKFNSNKGRTTKTRIELPNGVLNETALEFIKQETAIDPASLKPSVQIDYNRITLVNKNYSERITIDINLTISKNTTKRTFTNLVIAEVKQDKLDNSVFTQLMQEYRIKVGGMSKYCFGVSNLVEDVKKNNFKENNQRIIKLIQQ
jgi:hypothetical protein